MKRSKAYPRSTNAWMAECGYVNVSSRPPHIRNVLRAAGIATVRRGSWTYAPEWALRVIDMFEDMDFISMDFISEEALRVIDGTLKTFKDDPGALDLGTASSAHALGGWGAVRGVLGIP